VDKPNHGKLESIQALRGIAILLVLLIHVKRYEAFYAGDILPQVLGAGQAGVDLFFVISGFIMVTITRSTIGSVRASARFLGKRICRIYPLYWFYTLLLLPAYVFRPGFIHSKEMARQVDWVGTFTLYPTGTRPIIWQSWSLSLEIYFYLVFTVILLFEEKMLPKILFGWALLVLAGYFLGQTCFSWIDSPGLGLITHPMTLEFIGGSFVALLVWEEKWRIPPVPLLVAGGICLVIGAFVESDPSRHLRLVLFGIPSLMILAGAVLCERAGIFQFNRTLVFIGDISYSVYLTHVMVYGFLGRFWPPHLLPGVGKSLLFGGLVAAGALAFGALSYRFLEKPLLKLCYKTLRV
jgi:peptidoglycan/LPS O-acetylase OafA/YrhL